MGNLWKVLMFVWQNRELIWKVIQEIMDLFKDQEAKARVLESCHGCKPVVSQLHQEIGAKRG